MNTEHSNDHLSTHHTGRHLLPAAALLALGCALGHPAQAIVIANQASYAPTGSIAINGFDDSLTDLLVFTGRLNGSLTDFVSTNENSSDMPNVGSPAGTVPGAAIALMPDPHHVSPVFPVLGVADIDAFQALQENRVIRSSTSAGLGLFYVAEARVEPPNTPCETSPAFNPSSRYTGSAAGPGAMGNIQEMGLASAQATETNPLPAPGPATLISGLCSGLVELTHADDLASWNLEWLFEDTTTGTLTEIADILIQFGMDLSTAGVLVDVTSTQSLNWLGPSNNVLTDDDIANMILDTLNVQNFDTLLVAQLDDALAFRYQIDFPAGSGLAERFTVSAAAMPVPEPSVLALLGIGLLGIGGRHLARHARRICG